MSAKWRCSIDLMAVRATDDELEAVDAVDRGVDEIDRLERGELGELGERRRVERDERVGFAATVFSRMTVVTVRGGAVAAAVPARGGLSVDETTMITATPAPSSSAAIRLASAMMS